MAEKIFIGNFPKGLTLNPLPFYIDNNAFPTLYNFYVWRGRAKRKRGTIPLGRLQVYFSSTSAGSITLPAATYSLFSNIILFTTSVPTNVTIATDQPGANIAPGSASAPLVITIGTQTLTDATGTGVFVITPAGTITAATINYASGVLTLVGGSGTLAVTIVSGSYFPGLPVLGLEDFLPAIPPLNTQTGFPYPLLLAFDQEYSYQNFTDSSLASTTFFNTNYFKNPPDGTYTDGTTPYLKKGVQTKFLWTGQDYQQFWTTNFEGALWATNGTPGCQMQIIDTIVVVSTTKVTFTIANSPAIIGDFVFVNEIVDSGMTSGAPTINGQSGYVSDASGGTVTVVFPNANIVPVGTFSGGIMQYLTNVVPTATEPSMGDGIKWYDGDPTISTGLPSISPLGWVNFNPPLAAGGEEIDIYSSGPSFPFYLVGCKAIFPYKDRILFFGPYIATSATITSGGTATYLPDTVIWSWNGAPYYTASYILPVNPLTDFHPIITPGTGTTGTTITPVQGAAVFAYYTNQTGYGGFLSAGTKANIVTVGNNEDVLIVGFTNRQTRFVYTGNDLDPFQFYSINSELGTSATFSGITLDRGVIAFGTYGFTLTSQTGTQRIDLEIPDEAFQINSMNFGVQRINSARDFFKEWIYFSYSPNTQPSTCHFPTQSFFYNYREENWAIFYENFTAHGTFWRYANITWATLPYLTWDEWVDPWDSPAQEALFPNVIAGTPQGFVIVKAQGTGEAATGYVSNATASSGGLTNILSYNHCVQVGDYLFLSGFLGTTGLNGKIGQVVMVTDVNNFTLDTIFPTGTYGGLGVFTRLSQPLLQSKEFPPSWQMGRQTILGPQRYLLDTTDSGQVTLNIYLSQDPDDAWNMGPIVPSDNSPNNSLVYSQVLSTSPEYPINSIVNISLGDIGNGTITTFTSQLPFPLIPGSVVITIGNIASFTDNGAGGFNVTGTGVSGGSSVNYSSGAMVLVFSVAPNSILSFATYQYTAQNVQTPISAYQRQIWHRMNTSLIGDTVQFGITLSDAQMRNLDMATSEITLHAAVLSVSPGPELA